jgi:hypothetical protein
MSNLLVILALASCSAVFAQETNGGADRRNTVPSTAAEAPPPIEKRIFGNEKTIGAVVANNAFRTAEDNLVIGNAKTVGGDQPALAPSDEDGIGRVGNSKTVGGN